MKSLGLFIKKRWFKVLIGQLVAVALVTIIRETDWALVDFYHLLKVDKTPIKYTAQIDSVLVDFPIVKYKDLATEYKEDSGSDRSEYKAILKSKSYYKITRADLQKKIAGDFRIKNFVCKADINGSLWNSKSIYWLVDKKLIYKTLELQDSLSNRGYDPHGFTIVNAHRHPKENDRVGGAIMSRHLRGQAIDISIKDINKDGVANQEDKTIVLDLLENHIIKRKGGIGRYVGTMSIHYDVRGTYARWDSFKRKK